VQQLAPARRSGGLPQHGLVSLWDIMKGYSIRSFITLERFRELVSSGLRLEETRNNAFRQGGLLGLAELENEYKMPREFIAEFVSQLKLTCKEFGLEHTARNIETLDVSPPKTEREVCIYYDMVMNELSDHRFLHMPSDRAKYWESSELLSRRARERFPESAAEIRSAGSAYAASLFTASVFHSMRAAEIGLRRIAVELKVPITGDENWKNVIDQIEAKAKKLDDVPRHPTKASDSQFFCEVAIQAGLFKDAWRNQVAHTKSPPYSEPQALEILTATCRFYEKVAERFAQADEPPTTGV
jgi:hypothetical protein